MKKLGSSRLILWILIVMMLAYAVYVYKSAENTKSPSTPAVSQATVMSDFLEMKNIEVPLNPVLGGQFFTTELLFPAEFKGQVGDVFYARMEDGHVLATVSYRIDKLTEGVPNTASYVSVKVYGPDYEPAGDYTTKDLYDQEIEKTDHES